MYHNLVHYGLQAENRASRLSILVRCSSSSRRCFWTSLRSMASTKW